MKVALLMPIYQPSDKVLPFLRTFDPSDFDAFLVVDDGSGEEYKAIFDQVGESTPFEVLSYVPNKGKGNALKTGMKALLEKHPDLDFIITADGDGQHCLEDIRKVRDEAKNNQGSLLLGSRDFRKKGVPFKSRFGNAFSCFYFSAALHKKIKDTQTGLRAIPSCLFAIALKTEGNRFEYESNFLLSLRGFPIIEVPIRTIYEEKGEKRITHFRPIADSLIIYKTPLLYILVSVLSFGLDIGLFHIFSTFVFAEDMAQRVFISALIARVISGAFNFFMFHFVVFGRKDKIGKSAIKYIILWAINYGLSSSLTYLFNELPMQLTFIKVIIDIILAILNYLINWTWVFARKKIAKGKEQK